MSVELTDQPKPKKPSSPRRIAASRANGARSRGPVTPEGKARSSQNARTHGLTSKTVVLSNEEWPNYLALRACYIRRFRPADDAEFDQVEEMVVARWRLRRSWAIEAAGLDDQMENQRAELGAAYEHISEDVRTALAFKHLADKSNFATALNRYETRASRQFSRALKSLREMRNDFPIEPPNAGDETTSAPGANAGPSWQNERRLSP